MSTLFVDTINEKTSGNGIQIPGHPVQVLQAVKTDTFTTTSTSFVDVTGLSVTITPKSTSSKVLILGSLSGNGNHNTYAAHPQLVRGSTVINVGTGVGSRTPALAMLEVAAGAFATIPIAFLDSPATTSATTYKIRIRSNTGANIVFNRGQTDSDGPAYSRPASTLIVMEIAQ